MAKSHVTTKVNDDGSTSYYYDNDFLGTSKYPNGIVWNDNNNIVQGLTEPSIFKKMVDKGLCDDDGKTNPNFNPSTEVAIAESNAAKVLSDQKKAREARAAEVDNAGFQSVLDGYGQVPQRSQIKTLVQNVQGYGSGLSNLVYPLDLLDDDTTHRYNGSYTVMYISEHKDSTISHVRNFTTDQKYINNQGSSLASLSKSAISTTSEIAGAAAGLKLGESGTKGVKSLLSATLGKGITSGLAATALTTVGGAIGGATLASWITEVNTDFKQLKMAIALPTPAITDQHTLEWDFKDTMVGAGLAQLIDKGQTDGYMKAMFDSAKDIAQVGAMKVMNSMGAADTLNRALGKAPNTRREQIFQNVGFRSFTLEYSLAARDRDEVASIESIIRVLKYHAYPELSPSTFLYIYPAQFDIVHYFGTGVNSHMPRHATSVLKSINIDYAGGNSFISLHQDGSPVIINLKLEFVELAILNKDSIRRGY